MSDGASINVKVNLGGIEKKISPGKFQRVQSALANQVMMDSERFVPRREGSLRDSAKVIAYSRINYNRPYAHYQYSHQFANYSTPGTGGQWDKIAKGKYLPNWRALVAKRICE